MLIDFDESRATGGDVVDRLAELDRIMARLHAVQAELLVEAADVEPQVDEYVLIDAMTEEQRRILIEDAVRDELAVALRRSSVAMQDLIGTARVLVARVPDVLEALRAGDIAFAHARILADAAERLPEELLGEFQRRVLRRTIGRTLVHARRVVRETLLDVDPTGFIRRREQAKCARDVWIASEQDGMSLFMARLATEQAHALKIQIDADAFDRAYSIDAKAGLTMGEHRVEALAALILGGDGRGPAPTRAHVNVTIPLDTLLALRDDVADGTAELVGEGPLPATVVRELLQDPDCAVTLRRLVTDPVTGHLLDYGRTTYAIPQRLRDYIIARDKNCRFPGCNRRADLSQVDHAIAYADGGATSPENLGALCVRHHQLKTHGSWDITISRPDGTCQWRSPDGRIYESHDPPPDPPDTESPEPGSEEYEE